MFHMKQKRTKSQVSSKDQTKSVRDFSLRNKICKGFGVDGAVNLKLKMTEKKTK